MIPVTLTREPRKIREKRTFQCVTCLGIFTVRFMPFKRSCVDCEQLREQAKKAATNKVQYEIKAGRLKKPTEFACVDCGAPAKHYEHRDYTKPLEVDPVCIRCNRLRGPARL